MPNIAGREGEVVLQGCRDELTILDQDRWMKRHDPPPLVGAILIERENARAVAQHQCRKPCLEAGVVILFFSMPFLISPSVMTLKNKSVDETDPSQASALAFGRGFASSEMTLVSSRKLKARCAAAGAAMA